MLTLRFEAYGIARQEAPFVPPVGMRLQEYVLAYDEGRRRTIYIVAHDHGAAFGDAYLFDGKSWAEVARGKTAFGTTQKLGGFYDEARGGIATWNFEHDEQERRYVATSLLFDVRNGLSPIASRGDDPIAEPDGEDPTGTFDYMGLFAPDPKRAVTVCLTRRGVWELDADAVWRKRAELDSSFPLAWDDDGAGAAFDPIRGRAVFWLYTRAPEREYAFFSWDGQTLSRMSASGLPMKSLHVGLFDPAALVAAHPAHGLVLLAGEHGAFAFDGARWNALPTQRGDAPPRMKNGRMVYDGNVRGFVVGPGYHEGDPGGQEQQRVFWIEREGVWERMGNRATPSALRELWPKARHVNARGTWYAIASGDLRTLRWSDAGFVEISPKDEALLDGERIEIAIDARGTPNAITNRGSVLAFDDDTSSWRRLHGPLAAFGDRADFSATWDVSRERVVVWGGVVKNRASNDTFFFEGGAWRAAKKASPLPKDDRGRKAPAVDFTLVYDGALGRVLRFGREDVAMLEGDVWQPIAPKGYATLCGARAWEHFPAHDAKTGETVFVDLERGTVVRFDTAACTTVAAIAFPDEPARALLRETLSFERSTRLLHAQSPDRSSHRFALDLGPAFDAARLISPRKRLAAPTLEIAAVGARLYHPKKRTFWFVEGDAATSGPIGGAGKSEKLADATVAIAIAAKRKAGFVPAEKLPLAVLADLGAQKSRSLTVGKKTTKHGASHLGGLPSIAAKAWPKGMAFVFQLDAYGTLEKHAGVCVFSNEHESAAVLVTPAQWKKKPAAAPKGVTVLAPRVITAAPARAELDEARVRVLADKDPAMAAAFERFQKRAKMQASITSKLGGAPLFVQDSALHANYTFFAQLDFDALGLEPSLGVTGCVYVLVRRGEKDAIAFWQKSERATSS